MVGNAPTSLNFGLLPLGLLWGFRAGLIGQFLELGVESLGSGIDDWTEEILAQSGAVALGNAGTDTLGHCERKKGDLEGKVTD